MRNIKKGVLIALLITIVLILPAAAFAAPKSWSEVAANTQEILQKAIKSYEKGDFDKAKKEVDNAYFGPFETLGMEAAIRTYISANRAFEFEEKFREIKQQIDNEAPPSIVQKVVDELNAMLRQDAIKMDGGGSSGTYSFFINSLLIIVREGVEAILVIGALTAYMVKTGNQDKVSVINRSVVAALLASFLTAIGLRVIFNFSGAGQENLEGITMLIAVVVLFTVSYWLLSKAQAKKWQDYIQGKIQSSLTTGRSVALASAAFLAVYREGAETVLFYQALISQAGNSNGLGMVTGGFLLGMIILVGIYIATRYGSVRLPLKPFFTVTGIFLYYLAFVFAGEGMKELQAGGLVGITPVSGVPVIGILGIYPTLQSMSLQGVLLAAFFLGMGFQFFQNRASRKTAGMQEAKEEA